MTSTNQPDSLVNCIEVKGPDGQVLEPKIDPYLQALTAIYLQKHSGLVADIVARDAALKRYRETIEDEHTLAQARRQVEVYPGVVAMAAHEKANGLYLAGKYEDARVVSEHAHSVTGTDIHAGATIGDGLFLDHATGTVIGEQVVLGKRATLYHSVTLGAIGKTPKSGRRHPEIGDNCIISMGTSVLGHVLVGNNVIFGKASGVDGNNIRIGNNVRIGSNAAIQDDVELGDDVKVGDGALVVQGTGKITVEDLPEGRIPDHSVVSRKNGALSISVLHEEYTARANRELSATEVTI